MEIVLIANAETGQSAFPAEDIEGIPAPERRYNIVNGCMVLAGFSDAVLHHDADELLKQSVFRMPTPAEQNEMTGQSFKVGELQESVDALANFTAQVQRANGDGEAILTEQGESPDSGEVLSPDSQPPAVDKQKKASGG